MMLQCASGAREWSQNRAVVVWGMDGYYRAECVLHGWRSEPTIFRDVADDVSHVHNGLLHGGCDCYS